MKTKLPSQTATSDSDGAHGKDPLEVDTGYQEEQWYKDFLAAGSPSITVIDSDHGNVGGEPTPLLAIYDETIINQMSVDELRRALREAQDGWSWTHRKMTFYSKRLAYGDVFLKRDPDFPKLVWELFQKGKTDAEIAEELGVDSKRSVESVRLQMLKDFPELKRKRGRPPRKKVTTL